MCKRSCMACFLLGVVYLVLSFASAQALVHSYVEDFTTKQYCDQLNTTAWWNTVAGELKLHPFEITLVGNYNTPGYAYGVAISGDYAYVADGTSGLKVIDISDPTDPTLGGSYNTPGDAHGAAISGDYAYVADGASGLQVIDISAPTSPTLAGNYNTSGSAYGVAISGDCAYVADGASGLQVIDISAPTSPTLAGNYNTSGTAYGVAISGDYAYVADGTSGLQVIDISDPAAPTLSGNYNTSGSAYGVAISGDYAYVADGTSGLQVIDIGNSANLRLEGSYNTPGNARGVDISGGYAYVADDISGLQVLGIRNPAAPALIGGYELPGDAYSVVTSGDYLYLADYTSGLQVIDIADCAIPGRAGSCDTPDVAWGVAISGDHAYIADWSSGLQVIDISDPTNPALAGGCATPGDAYAVAVSGDYAYVADWDLGLQVIDISDPASPALVGNYDTPSQARGVAISGDYAYVADYVSGLQVIDISDPTTPTYAGSYDTPHYASGVAISGDYAYVADYFSGLQVIDISDPANPTYAGSYNTPGYARGVAVSGDYAYVADESYGLQVIDISNPASPAYAGSYDTPGNAYGVAISGDYAYVCDRLPGLYIIDISDPTTPVFAASYDTPGYAYAAVISGDYAYVADAAQGLQVIEVFERRFYADPKTAQSLSTDYLDDTIVTARLNSTQIDSIRWELSADGGANWQEFRPDGLWQAFASTGSDLLWRSVHVYRATEPEINPTCTSLQIEWLYRFPVIEPISDIPGDQGHQVRITWARSDYDRAGSSTPITEYAIFRRIDQGLSSFANLSGSGDMDARRETSMETDGALVAYPPGDWDFVQTVPAYCEDSYSTVIPTLVDSSQSDGIQYSTFFIRAATANSGVYFDAYPDSGYSTDDLAPSEPGGLGMASRGELSAEGGTGRQGFGPAGAWQASASTDTDFLWKSVHVLGTSTPEVNSPATNLEIESISDIPGDQGHQVRIAWTRSDYDAPGSSPRVTKYTIFRKIDQGLLSFANLRGPRSIDAKQEMSMETNQVLGAYPSGDWDVVKTVPAYCEDSYSTVVSTLLDSTQSEGVQYSTFFIRAGTASPSVHFDSYPATGYSADNLAAAPPPNLRMTAPTEVAWGETEEEDFDYFTVYGSSVPVLDPTATLIGYTIQTVMDVTDDQYEYYHVTSTDFSGNEGDASSIQSTGGGIDPGEGLPKQFALKQNQPNPFETFTTISFDLPEPCVVRLEVMDVQGRVVRVLTDEVWAAGRHSIDWTGKNDDGEGTGPGVYFVRIQAASFTATDKMLIMK
jgi:hypothetical protein